MNGTLSRLTRAILLLTACILSAASALLAPPNRPDLSALSLAFMAGFAGALLRLLSNDNGHHDKPPEPPAFKPDPKHWP